MSNLDALTADRDELKVYGNHEDFPVKKTLLTTFTFKRTPEATAYFTQRRLELSRISRRASAAQMKYQRLRAEELRLISSIYEDEVQEMESHLDRTDLQIGSLRNDLFNSGMEAIGNNEIMHHAKKGAMVHHHEADDTSESDDRVLSAASGSVYNDENGVQMSRAQIGKSAPAKIHHIYIPRTAAELYDSATANHDISISTISSPLYQHLPAPVSETVTGAAAAAPEGTS